MTLKSDITGFFSDNVAGRRLVTDDVVYTLEGGALEGVYSDTMIFSGLSENEYGLSFYMTTVTNEKLYTLEDGRRCGLKEDYTGTSVFRYELAERKSTGGITGYMRCVSTTVRNQTMAAVVYGVYGVKLENGRLGWKEIQLMYRDTPAGDGSFRPVAFDSEISFYLEDGKLRFEYLPRFWDVDPLTFGKTLADTQYPPFVSKER